MYYVSRMAGTVALAALGIAIWFSIVLARADSYFRAATPETAARAVEIAPRNTEYLALRALQLDYDGVDSSALTDRIAVLNPDASAPRIKLGLAAEMRGDAASAERWLLDAARVDHQFESRWTLANFYFRAGRVEEFWKWMRPALEVSYGDRTPAFDLCWRVNGDAEEILRLGIPDRHEVVGAYLIYLSGKTEPLPPRQEDTNARKTRADEGVGCGPGGPPHCAGFTGEGMAGVARGMVDVARRLAGYHDAADLPLIYGACDQLVAARDPGALDVWMLIEAAPLGIFNGDFARAPLNHGFDWREIASAGVTHVNLDAPPGHRIALSGQQPESCSLMEQTVRLRAGKRYRLQWEARTAGIKSPAGLEWRIGGEHAALAPSADWTAGELTISAGELFEVLQLAYQRPVGESRAEGNVELRHVRLAEVTP
jgi:hypothetical protein